MAKKSLGAIKSLFYHYLWGEGWLPAGTTAKNWGQVRVPELGLDQPPLTHAPDLQKDRMGLDLVALVWALGAAIPSPTALLGNDTLTLAEVAKGIYESQEAV
jgi:hypothetical protein